MVVYTLEQRWEILRQIDRGCWFWQKKNHLFRWSPFWSWVYKKAKLSHLGHRKPARIYWKVDVLKTSHCLVRILVQRHNWAILLRKWARRSHYSQWRSLSGHAEIGNFWFQQDGATSHRAKATLDVLRPFFKIALSASELMSFSYLLVAIWHSWIIICGEPSKVSVTPTSQRQLTL